MVLMMSSTGLLVTGVILTMLLVGKSFPGEHVNGATSKSVVDLDGHSDSIDGSHSNHINFHDIGTKPSGGFEMIEEKRLLEETTRIGNLLQADYSGMRKRRPPVHG